jgi:hypothetical protein
MKKFIIIGFAAASLAISACTGTDKTNRNSDTSAAKGSGGPTDSAQGVESPSPSATTPGSSDTSNIGKNPAEPMGDTVKKTP